MPYVQVQVGGKLTKAQKKQIAKEFCNTLLKVAKKPKNHTYIVFDEVDRSNWAIGEKFLNEK